MNKTDQRSGKPLKKSWG